MVRKVDLILLLESRTEVPVTIWAEQAEIFEDKYRVIEDNNIVLIMTSVLVKSYQGALQLSASSSTKFYLNNDSDCVTEFRKSLKYDGGCSIKLRTMIHQDKTDEQQQSITHIWDYVSSDNPMAIGMLSFKIEMIVDDGHDCATLILWDLEASRVIRTTAPEIAIEDTRSEDKRQECGIKRQEREEHIANDLQKLPRIE
ncbi:unnamed protein product [Arabis nemorensis]|uniref:Replication protein A OB domain-containing protein n=1 Tax=Arabis nemorensis TaxID=586526 RepID=A0A565AT04_9BRAS|nr:unnamed protein product [Arabis nemorensis]